MIFEPKDAEEVVDTTAETESVQPQLQACQAEVEIWKDKYLRTFADFNNFKRRTEKEQAHWMQSAQADVLKNILPSIDDIDRAIAESHKKEQTPEMQAWLAGFEMIGDSLHKFLKKSGVEEITQIATFDPTLHEALAAVEVPGKKEGDIVDVLQKGFMFKGDVLRPAKVAVAK